MPANGRKLGSWNSIKHYIWFSKRKEMFGTKANTCSLAAIYSLNMNRFLLILVFILVSCSSCLNKSYSIFLKSTDSHGLNNTESVWSNGGERGQINKVSLGKDGSVIIELNIQNGVELPIDSKFNIETLDLLGSQGISVEYGKNRQSISKNDTIKMSKDSVIKNDNVISKTAVDVLNNLLVMKKYDSLLIELRRLNRNIENNKK